MKTSAVLAAAALIVGAAWLWTRKPADEAEQDPGALGALYALYGQAFDNTDPMTADANLRAFLRTIRHAEGTAGANGYRTMFGGALFTSFADHPRRAVQFRDGAGRLLWTSAAGAYQFMAVSPLPSGSTTKVDTWDRLKRKLGLPDFSPASQDAAAVELIREAGALPDVRAGRFDAAVSKVRRIWASLPGAGYSQPEKSITSLRTVYAQAGGTLA
jgi:lysozyme